MINKKIFLTAKFIELNANLFDNKLSLPTIDFDKTINCWGLYSPKHDILLINEKLFDGDGITLRKGSQYELGRAAFCQAVLIHEMVHIENFQIKKISFKNNIHGKAFYETALEVGKKLNYKPITSYEELDQWPVSILPNNYFLGASIVSDKWERIESRFM
jgi:hypothetical protein